VFRAVPRSKNWGGGSTIFLNWCQISTKKTKFPKIGRDYPSSPRGRDTPVHVVLTLLGANAPDCFYLTVTCEKGRFLMVRTIIVYKYIFFTIRITTSWNLTITSVIYVREKSLFGPGSPFRGLVPKELRH